MSGRYGKRVGLRAAAAYLQMPPDRLRRLVAEKRITYMREGARGYIEFFERDLDAYLESQRVVATLPEVRRSVDDDVADYMRANGIEPERAH